MDVHDLQTIDTSNYGKNFRTTPVAQPSRSAQEPAKAKATVQSELEEAQKTDTTTAMERITQPVERFMNAVGVAIEFKVNEDSGEMQAVVTESGGDKVIRKIPSDEVIRLAASIREMSDHFLNKAL